MAEPTLSRSSVQRAIRERLRDALTIRGWAYRARLEMFVRPIPDGLQGIGVALAWYGIEGSMTPLFGVRIEEAERIRHRFSGVPSRDQDLSATVTTDSKLVLGVEDFEVHAITQLEPTIERMVRLIVDQGLPFLDRYTSVEALDQALNRDQIDGFDIMGTGQHQIQRIIVASLARNDGFERLVTELDRSIPGAHLDRPMFVSVVDYLRTTG